MTRLPRPVRPLFPLAKRAALLATAGLRPVSCRLSLLLGDRALPRRSALSTAAHAAAHPAAGIQVTPVLPGFEVSRALPVGRPPAHWCFAAKRKVEVSGAFVAQIPGGRVVGRSGAALAPDGTLLFDLSPYFGVFRPEHHPIFLRLCLPPVEEVAGSVAVLTTRGVDNYYHFLLDVLPRLDLLEATGIRVDRYVVNRSLPFQAELLEGAGIPADRVVESRVHPHLRADRLVVPSLPDAHLRAPGWVVTSLRRRFLPDGVANPSRRLFLGRGSSRHSRSLRNEEAVVAMLAARGVTTFVPDGLPVHEQARTFAEAELIVAVHGAALTNLVFCSPGTVVVELFAPDYVNVCYWALACQVEGLRYRYVVGRGRAPRPGREMMGVSSDLDIDPEVLGAVLDDMAA